jgi:hypothetical protein
VAASSGRHPAILPQRGGRASRASVHRQPPLRRVPLAARLRPRSDAPPPPEEACRWILTLRLGARSGARWGAVRGRAHRPQPRPVVIDAGAADHRLHRHRDVLTSVPLACMLFGSGCLSTATRSDETIMIMEERLRRLLSTHDRMVRPLRYVVTALIVFIVVAGSLKAFFDFVAASSASMFGFLLIGITLAGALLFVYVTRPDVRPQPKVGVPPPPPVPTRPPVKLLSLTTRWHLEEIIRLAAAAFGNRAMPPAQIRDLHWHCRDTVYLLTHEEQGIVGYLALMFPTLSSVDRMFQGTIDTLDLRPHHFTPGSQGWAQSHLYVESVVVVGPHMTPRLVMLARHALDEIEKNIGRYRPNDEPLHVFGLAGTTEGRNLLHRFLGLTCVAKAPGRADEMDLYADEKRIADIRQLRQDLEATIQNLLMHQRLHV